MIPNFSTRSRMLAAAAVLATLGGCATMGSGKQAPAGDYATLYSRAEADVSAGRVDSALAGFSDAAKADPSKKEPWVRTAQLQFDKGNYANAIIAAEEVMQRDPDDLVADSVLAVGGFRIANQSLERLRGNGALSSQTARSEAERLVKTMRDTMGEDIMLAGTQAEARPEPRTRRTTSRRSTSSTASPVSSPRAEPSPKPEPRKEETRPASDPFQNIGGN